MTRFLSHGWHLIVLLGLLGASAFFNGTETALFNLTRGQLYRLGRSGSKLARLVPSLMRRPQRLLQTLLLGNMIVNVGYTSLSALLVLMLAESGLATWLAAILSLLPLLVLILVGEVTPKILAYRVSEGWAVAAAAPMAVVDRALFPVVWVLERSLIGPLSRMIAPRRTGSDISAEELAALLDLSARRGLLDADANALLREIMHLTDIRVADIMVPRVDMVAHDINDPPQQLIELFRESHLRKVPVYEGDIDQILGVIYAKRVLLEPSLPKAELRRLVEKVPFVPEAATIERVLVQLRVTRRQMAIVVDEYGGVAGMVTLEDIVEEIVGDIGEDREDRGPAVRRVGENEYIIDGDLPIHEWLEAFAIDLSGLRISTVGGFVISLLGRMPALGDQVDYRNLRFVVEEMRGRRISRLRVHLQEASE